MPTALFPFSHIPHVAETVLFSFTANRYGKLSSIHHVFIDCESFARSISRTTTASNKIASRCIASHSTLQEPYIAQLLYTTLESDSDKQDISLRRLITKLVDKRTVTLQSSAETRTRLVRPKSQSTYPDRYESCLLMIHPQLRWKGEPLPILLVHAPVTPDFGSI